MSQQIRQQIKKNLQEMKLNEDDKKEFNNFFYKKSSQDYQPEWAVQRMGYTALNFQSQLRDQKVPQYSNVGKEELELRLTQKLLKNQLINKKISEKNQEEQQKQQHLNNLERTKLQLNKGTVTTKLFPFKKLNSNGNLESCEIDYPQNGMKVGNILYQTENMNIGLLKPNTAEITNKYYPRNARFTKAETENYRNNSLNCAWTFSKVHKKLNEF